MQAEWAKTQEKLQIGGIVLTVQVWWDSVLNNNILITVRLREATRENWYKGGFSYTHMLGKDVSWKPQGLLYLWTLVFTFEQYLKDVQKQQQYLF